MALTKPECKELASHLFVMLHDLKRCSNQLQQGYGGAAISALDNLAEVANLAYQSEDITAEELGEISKDFTKLRDSILPYPLPAKEPLYSSLFVIDEVTDKFEHFIVDKIVECQCP